MRSLLSALIMLSSVTAAAQSFAAPETAAARAPVETARPARGSTAPANMKVWLETSFQATDFQLRNAQGTAVATTAVTFPISNNFSNLVVLTPTASLTPGNYSVARQGLEVTAFTVTAEVDTTAPAALVATATGEAFPQRFGQPTVSRGSNTSAAVDFGVEPELALVTAKDEQFLPNAAFAMSAIGTKQVFLVGFKEGSSTELAVFHFDLAGNVTRSEVTLNVPLATGCSVSAAWPLSLLGLALLRRRSARSSR